jgi:outer membrane protein
MKRLLLASAVLSAMAFAGSARAQSPFDLSQPPVGKQAGTVMIRVRAIGVIPLDASSSVSGIGGHVSTTAQAAPEIDGSYFLTDNIAVELIAATTRHSLSATGTAVGKVDVGSTWVLPPTLTLQYHFMPAQRISPYVGAGINASFFYGTRAAGPTVTHLSVNDSWGPAIQAGVDYNFSGHWFANIDVKQIFLNTAAHVSAGAIHIKAKDSLDPLVIGAGLGYRF